jgi:hypothetical protein
VTQAAPLAFALSAQLALAGPGADAWARAGIGAARGVTVGPIENAYHPDVGYGSPAYDRTLGEAASLGATWVAITPFGRVGDLAGGGVDLTFEMPFERNRGDVARAVAMAHARGLHVMLVPHLWVESGGWRALIAPLSEEGWTHWSASYERFVRSWAEVAEQTHAEMFSAGVELRSWVTGPHARLFRRVLATVRRVYHGLVTYSANWDDVDDTVVLGELDVIGVNAFYPLAQDAGAPDSALLEGARAVARRVHALAEAWGKPVLFTEIGYATRPDPAVRPWEWPETFQGVRVDEAAQAAAYRALLAAMLDERDFAGFFVWRVYADPDDVSQEAPWGFSPRAKLAEFVVRDAFAARWAADPPWFLPR